LSPGIRGTNLVATPSNIITARVKNDIENCAGLPACLM
jgi:hypothetical protein